MQIVSFGVPCSNPTCRVHGLQEGVCAGGHKALHHTLGHCCLEFILPHNFQGLCWAPPPLDMPCQKSRQRKMFIGQKDMSSCILLVPASELNGNCCETILEFHSDVTHRGGLRGQESHSVLDSRPHPITHICTTLTFICIHTYTPLHSYILTFSCTFTHTQTLVPIFTHSIAFTITHSNLYSYSHIYIECHSDSHSHPCLHKCIHTQVARGLEQMLEDRMWLCGLKHQSFSVMPRCVIQ